GDRPAHVGAHVRLVERPRGRRPPRRCWNIAARYVAGGHWSHDVLHGLEDRPASMPPVAGGDDGTLLAGGIEIAEQVEPSEPADQAWRRLLRGGCGGRPRDARGRREQGR